MKDQINALLVKEMTRKEFLQHIGSAMLIMLGISGVLKTLTSLNAGKSQKSEMGYGVSPYGG